VFQDARQAFTENKFKEAIGLFTRALVLNPNHTTLLDCRAASYEKLNELDLALKDASAIVKLSPKDARGYLRAGKILSLQKHYEKAIHIYQRALKKVDPTDTRFALLLNMKELAEKALKPPPKHDMMTKLPYDVISLVFSYISFDRRIQCSAVSKSWRQFAVNWSGMWRDLEFGNRKVSMNVIKRYLGYAQGRHVRSFSIHNANRNMMKNILQTLIDENCQYIECLGSTKKETKNM
jgi:tetratricopeptide (TPR) repeat protein